jgi:hypothetical protein
MLENGHVGVIFSGNRKAEEKEITTPEYLN